MTHDNAEQLPDFCTIRDGGEDWHIECRFPDGQKFAAVTVDIEHEKLAHFVADAINTRVQPTPASAMDGAITDPNLLCGSIGIIRYMADNYPEDDLSPASRWDLHMVCSLAEKYLKAQQAAQPFACPSGLTCSGDGWDCVGDGLCEPVATPVMELARMILEIDAAACSEGLYIGGGYNPRLSEGDQEGPMWKAIKAKAEALAAAGEGVDESYLDNFEYFCTGCGNNNRFNFESKGNFMISDVERALKPCPFCDSAPTVDILAFLDEDTTTFCKNLMCPIWGVKMTYKQWNDRMRAKNNWMEDQAEIVKREYAMINPNVRALIEAQTMSRAAECEEAALQPPALDDGKEKINEALIQCLSHLRKYGMIEDGESVLKLLPPNNSPLDAERGQALEAFNRAEASLSAFEVCELSDKTIEIIRQALSAPAWRPKLPESFYEQMFDKYGQAGVDAISDYKDEISAPSTEGGT